MPKENLIDRQIVICPICKKNLITQAKIYFRHCEKVHLVKDNSPSTKSEEISLEKNFQKQEIEAVNNAENNNTDSAISLQNAIPKEEQILEIAEAVDDDEPQEQNYKCPFCNKPVRKFGDCENPDCLAELSWSE